MVSKTTNILAILSLLIIYSCSTKKQANSGEGSTRPNILFIVVDDLRPELGVYGASHIHSPSIDRLANESLILDRAYCNVPVCGASRASLLSGVRPGWNRFIEYHAYLDKDRSGIVSLPKHFKDNGYRTISLGKVYHNVDDDTLAWDEIWLPSYTNTGNWLDYSQKSYSQLGKSGMPYEKANVPDTAYVDGKIARKAVQDLKAYKNTDKPFFMAVGFAKPHLPFTAPTKYWELYDSAAVKLPPNYLQPETTPKEAFHKFGELRYYSEVPSEGPISDEMANKLIHGYYACVSYVDAMIGQVLNTLEETGLADNTIVILWGDHGWNLGDHQLWCKHCNFESSLHVPLLLKVPGQTNGQRTKSIVEFVDIYPTLAELAGLPLPSHLDGESMMPLLKGGTREKNYAISKWHGGVTIVNDNYFYTEFIDKEAEVQARMLFDHDKDTLELDNLAESPEYQVKVEELHHLLRENWGDDFFIDYSKAN